MPTPPVSGRLRSACVVLETIEQHTPAVQAFWAGTARPGGSYTADDAVRNMADLMAGTVDTLQNRSRLLHAFDALVEEERQRQPQRRALEGVEVRLRLRCQRLQEAMAFAEDTDRLPRDLLRLCQRARRLLERLGPPPEAGGDPDRAEVETALLQLEDGLLRRHPEPPALAELGRIRAMEAFDETLDDTVEMVQGMLQLCGRRSIAEGLRTSWAWPGWLEDRHALNAVSARQVEALLSEPLEGAFDPVPLDPGSPLEGASPGPQALSS